MTEPHPAGLRRTGPLLARDPEDRVRNLAELAAIAGAIERESLRRYEVLAAEMDRRGETATAQTFRDLRDEELSHLGTVEQWSRQRGIVVPRDRAFVWHLPPELGTSWDEAMASALLTSYRALAIAVTNEERAFAYYAYIAANTDDRAVATEAERLAAEELRHAALLRRRRRAAYHAEHDGHPTTQIGEIALVTDLQALARRLEAETAGALEQVARDLAAQGAAELADFIGILAHPGRAAFRLAPPSAARPGPAPVPASALKALRSAAAALERMAETYEIVAERARSEDVLVEAQRLLGDVVERIAALGAWLDAVEEPTVRRPA